MHKDRLLRLADLLEADAVNPKGFKFDLMAWGGPASIIERGMTGVYDLDLRNEIGFKEGNLITLDCNTAACAVGLAALSGVFKDEGLGYVIDEGFITPTFGKSTSFHACRKFFDIDEDEVTSLFTKQAYSLNLRKGKDGELAVAARIREFVETRCLPNC